MDDIPKIKIKNCLQFAIILNNFIILLSLLPQKGKKCNQYFLQIEEIIIFSLQYQFQDFLQKCSSQRVKKKRQKKNTLICIFDIFWFTKESFIFTSQVKTYLFISFFLICFRLNCPETKYWQQNPQLILLIIKTLKEKYLVRFWEVI